MAPAIAGILGRARTGAGRRRPVRLSSRRHEGGRRVGARPRPRPGHSGPRACHPGRVWQHVGPDRAVRAGAPDLRGPAVTNIADCDGARLHRELRLPEESRVTPAVLLLAAVTLERLRELWLARRNTAALLAQGAARGRVRALSADRADACALARRLVGSWRWTRPIDPAWLAVFLALQVLRVWVHARSGRRWTTRIIVASRRAAGDERVHIDSFAIRTTSSSSARSPSCRSVSACRGLRLVFSIANLAVLAIRIRAETGVHSDRGMSVTLECTHDGRRSCRRLDRLRR